MYAEQTDTYGVPEHRLGDPEGNAVGSGKAPPDPVLSLPGLTVWCVPHGMKHARAARSRGR
jgi:hypothetical protein